MGKTVKELKEMAKGMGHTLSVKGKALNKSELLDLLGLPQEVRKQSNMTEAEKNKIKEKRHKNNAQTAMILDLIHQNNRARARKNGTEYVEENKNQGKKTQGKKTQGKKTQGKKSVRAAPYSEYHKLHGKGDKKGTCLPCDNPNDFSAVDLRNILSNCNVKNRSKLIKKKDMCDGLETSHEMKYPNEMDEKNEKPYTSRSGSVKSGTRLQNGIDDTYTSRYGSGSLKSGTRLQNGMNNTYTPPYSPHTSSPYGSAKNANDKLLQDEMGSSTRQSGSYVQTSGSGEVKVINL
jgi:hypothetical protein